MSLPPAKTHQVEDPRNCEPDEDRAISGAFAGIVCSFAFIFGACAAVGVALVKGWLPI